MMEEYLMNNFKRNYLIDASKFLLKENSRVYFTNIQSKLKGTRKRYFSLKLNCFVIKFLIEVNKII